MEPESPYGGIAGALILATAGWLGKSLLAWVRARSERRKVTTEHRLSSSEHARSQANELLQFAYKQTQDRIEDLEGAIDRIANSERRLQDTVDRLRAERDEAKDTALADRLRSRELDQKLGECRRLHHDLKCELERQAAEIERLRG